MPNAGEHPKKRNFICDLSEWASQRQTHDVEKSGAMKLWNSTLEISPRSLSVEKTFISTSHLETFWILKEKWLHIKFLLRYDVDGSIKLYIR